MSQSTVARYSNDAKQAARDAIWTEGAKIYKQNPGDVLMLGGSTPLEITTGIRHGIPPERIICVEKNPAYRAHLTRRMSPQLASKVRLLTGDVIDIANKSLKKRSILFAHLDFCGKLTSVFPLVRDFCASEVLYKDAFIVVTLQSGREGDAPKRLESWGMSYGQVEHIRKRVRLSQWALTFLDSFRLAKLLRATSPWEDLRLDVRRLLKVGKYVSNRVPMLWALIDLTPTKITTLAERWSDVEFRTKNIAATRQRWNDAEYRARMTSIVESCSVCDARGHNARTCSTLGKSPSLRTLQRRQRHDARRTSKWRDVE